MTPVRILLIAPDPLARAALAALLDSAERCVVAGQSDGQQDWHDALDLFNPDVILCDVGWQNSLTLPDLRELDVNTVALVPDQDTASAVWQSGVRGILGRDVSAENLATTLQAVYQNLTVIGPELMPSALDADLENPLVEPLTAREHDVLKLLATGMTNRAIALQLDISDHTVKFHVNALMSKLAAQSRTEAAVKATRLGLLSL